MLKMPKLFECEQCGATFGRMLIDTPELCSDCARRQEVEMVGECAADEDRYVLIEGSAWGDAD